jgi:hypothetical protein|tara:strand:+ start:457 stop:1065 length:609 start_codon:yes stop_codon:yes gene_type:complete
MYDNDTGMDFNVETKDTCRPLFRYEAVQNKAKSSKEGRPIFDQRAYVQILSPGDTKNIIDTPVQDEHKKRWPNQWEAFEKGSEQPVEGTPINEWPRLNMAQVHELKAVNIFTIEQLAELSDNAAQASMGLATLKKHAEVYLAKSKDDGVVFEALDKVEKLEDKMEALIEENKLLRAQAELSQKTKRRRKTDVSTDDSASDSG